MGDKGEIRCRRRTSGRWMEASFPWPVLTALAALASLHVCLARYPPENTLKYSPHPRPSPPLPPPLARVRLRSSITSILVPSSCSPTPIPILPPSLASSRSLLPSSQTPPPSTTPGPIHPPAPKFHNYHQRRRRGPPSPQPARARAPRATITTLLSQARSHHTPSPTTAITTPNKLVRTLRLLSVLKRTQPTQSLDVVSPPSPHRLQRLPARPRRRPTWQHLRTHLPSLQLPEPVSTYNDMLNTHYITLPSLYLRCWSDGPEGEDVTDVLV